MERPNLRTVILSAAGAILGAVVGLLVSVTLHAKYETDGLVAAGWGLYFVR
jgi:hypothetical protein